MSKLETNKEILSKLDEYITAHPESEFSTILWDVGIADVLLPMNAYISNSAILRSMNNKTK